MSLDTTIIPNRGGHCFFELKTATLLATAGFKINKTKIVLTLSYFVEEDENE
ncbi:hypothetical protein [Clostridium estertheticum]|uniref:hypothetical protein n=1 Tax=Clostridium estertheticum TaxID=238834 RepID=UPI001C7D2903|nr:hypothetical protein [Clostridium estertheticum]MBX4260224.1 hypothetical protein [Clostridium estertheticum]